MHRFDLKVDRSAGPESCWLWTGSRDTSGYGTFRVGKRMVPAHRFALERVEDLVPGLLVLHRCDTPSCVNPVHLRQGTESENCGDRIKRGRHHGLGGDGPKISPEDREYIVTQSSAGVTVAALARHFKVARSTIRYHLDHKQAQTGASA